MTKPTSRGTTKKATKAPARRPRKAMQAPPPVDTEQPSDEPEPTLDDALREEFRKHLNDDQIDTIIPLLADVFRSGISRGQVAGMQQGRTDAARALTFLAEAHADQILADPPETMTRDQIIAAAHAEATVAQWLAGIIGLTQSAAGFVPSWRWNEWRSLMADQNVQIQN